ncbi:Gag-Pol polyprotein [Plecturocebus cupreus]
MVAVPRLLGPAVVLAAHETFSHLGQETLEKLLGWYFHIFHLSTLAKTVTQCTMPDKDLRSHQESRLMKVLLLKTCKQISFRCLSAEVTDICWFWWVEVYPTRTEKTREVTHALLRDIIPRFGLPLQVGSDNGPAF